MALDNTEVLSNLTEQKGNIELQVKDLSEKGQLIQKRLMQVIIQLVIITWIVSWSGCLN